MTDFLWQICGRDGCFGFDRRIRGVYWYQTPQTQGCEG
mgnify:CR=1 FL=1